MARPSEMAHDERLDVDKLFESAMQKRWKDVLRAYEEIPASPEAKLTKSKETALHIAVSSYHADEEDATKLEEWVTKLVKAIPNSQILGMRNDKGNTPLHFAAALGSAKICSCIALRDQKLMEIRNNDSETPIFLAAKHGKLEAFLCLHEVWGENNKPDESLLRRKDGCNILHAAINGEYFDLALQIISKYEILIGRKNEEGLSPLHVLAMKPGVFHSSSNFRLCDRIIYRCLYVPELKVKEFNYESYKRKFRSKRPLDSPGYYKTLMSVMQTLKIKGKSLLVSREKLVKFLAYIRQLDMGKDEESQEMEDNAEGSLPPNYATCLNFFKFAIHLMLVILGIGSSRIKKIQEKKQKHTWAFQIMNEFIRSEKDYKYRHDGESPDKGASLFELPPMPFETDEQGDSVLPEQSIKSHDNEESEEDNKDKPVEEDRCVVVTAKMKKDHTLEKLRGVLPDAIQELEPEKSYVVLRYQKKKTPTVKKETPILVAAKLGIIEMIDKILETFPVAIQDVDEHDKNALLLAIENRQNKVFDLLMKKKLPEFVLYQVDDEGNSVLHLAAKFQQQQPWRIPGAALQMQWEIKWYKHVKHTMPLQYLVHCRKNHKGETARQIFTMTHEKLVKDGSEWLIKTSESCSVVAALIATVAFATSTGVPGGVNDETGHPNLEGQPAFDIFSIGSLFALCFSVTSLVFFLAILTSRCQEKDFRYSLPKKLLFGLSSLFTSIAAILLSFCAGHFFVLNEELHNSAFLLYAITCLPVSFFAFAQLPLYFDLIWSSFKKVPLRCYKVSQ